MNIYFGENLKSMRNAKGLTQVELGRLLGVSFQTISKWERGAAYPDITALPEIASFFSTTIDELLGADKAEQEKNISHLLTLFDTMHVNATSTLFAEFQRAVTEFPNDYRILIRYLELLTMEKDNPYIRDTSKNSDEGSSNPYKAGLMKNPDYEAVSQEILSIYEKIQNHCTDDDIRIWAKNIVITHLVKRYHLSFDEKTGKWCCDVNSLKIAEDILKTMPTLANAREIVALRVNDNRPDIDAMEELLYLLQSTIEGYCYYDEHLSNEKKIEIVTALNTLINMLEGERKNEKNIINLIYNYGNLGRLYALLGDYENAIHYLRLCAQCATELDENPNLTKHLLCFYGTGKMFREMDNMSSRMKELMTNHYHLPADLMQTNDFKQILALLD